MARVTPDDSIGSTKIAASPAAAQPSPIGERAHDDQSWLAATRLPSGRMSVRTLAFFTSSRTSGHESSIRRQKLSKSPSLTERRKFSVRVTAPTDIMSGPIGKYQIHPSSTAAMKTVERSRLPLNVTFHSAFDR